MRWACLLAVALLGACGDAAPPTVEPDPAFAGEGDRCTDVAACIGERVRCICIPGRVTVCRRTCLVGDTAAACPSGVCAAPDARGAGFCLPEYEPGATWSCAHGDTGADLGCEVCDY